MGSLTVNAPQLNSQRESMCEESMTGFMWYEPDDGHSSYKLSVEFHLWAEVFEVRLL